MDQALTLGMVIWTLAAILGVVGIIGAFVVFLSILANQFKH